MNILVLCDKSGNDDEGMKKISREIASELNKNKNCKVYLSSPKNVFLNKKKYNNIDIVHSLSGPTFKTFIYIYIIHKLLKKNPKTIISIIHPLWNYLSYLMLLTFKPKAIMVFSYTWQSFFKKFDIKLSSFSVMGYDQNKFFKVNKNKKERIRKKLKLPLNKKIVLHVGHLNKGRNLKVLGKFKNETNFHVLVIGSTTVNQDKNLVKELKLDGINIINEYLPNIDEYYKASDCYLFPTLNPHSCIQVPLSVVEALACGLPVISSRFEGLPFYFGNNHNIKFVSSFRNLINDTKKLLSKKQICNNQINKFNWKNISKALFDFYGQILK